MIHLRRSLLFVATISLTLCSFALRASAQLAVDPTSLDMEVSPRSPAPETTVNFRLTNYLIDLTTSDIRWYVNGSLKARGVGLVSFSTKTGKAGSATRVQVSLTTRDGQTLTQEITLRPALVDLIWQADSTVPPLYRGKALPSTKNNVTFFALPHFSNAGSQINPSSLLYEWRINFDPATDGRGVGKSSYTTKIVDLVGETDVRVRVSTIDGQVSAEAHLVLSPSSPIIQVLEVKDLLGSDFDHPLTNKFNLSGDEVTLRALGFYFPKSHLAAPGLSYRFTVGGKPALTPDARPDRLTLRRAENTEGTSVVTASINDPFDSFISAAKTIVVNFGSVFEANFQ